ncbi:MAG TPA: hypothetical protein VF221_04090 [Chloroflexota bacterium]
MAALLERSGLKPHSSRAFSQDIELSYRAEMQRYRGQRGSEATAKRKTADDRLAHGRADADTKSVEARAAWDHFKEAVNARHSITAAASPLDATP